MGKSMLIGEVSRISGISARMLRHYDSLGLVSPSRRSSAGYRMYSPEDLRRLFSVESLRSLGLSLADVRRALDDREFTPSRIIDELIATTRERIAHEEQLLAELQRVKSATPADWTQVLPTIALLRGLSSEDASHRQRATLSTAAGAPVNARLLAEALLHEPDPNVAGALRWALGHTETGADGLAVLASALESSNVETRLRAVEAIAELTTEETVTVLDRVLDDPDATVRTRAALALGARGVRESVPVLIRAVVDGTNDTEAADTLGRLAAQHDLTGEITTMVTERLAHGETTEAARVRLTEALAELPGQAADVALAELTRDEQHVVQLTARSILQLRH